ncbi:DMT family transporter [Oricola sp.]|uniref:DMT family transporter n=1 Tax=Oricola sp. TaxID=1979950 RepID=UPI003BACBF3D
MSAPSLPASQSNPAAGIALILVGMVTISINDMLIKQLSGDYPLHQMVFARSAIGIWFSLVMVWFEGGLAILRTRHWGFHTLRGLAIVVANISFFTALAVIPLGEATALFFVAPLMITLLSIPLLGERVGPYRLGAVLVGFLGVLVMVRPWQGDEREAGLFVLLLPVISATTYALFQIMTRRLGAVAKASAMAVYVQTIFIVVSAGFFLVAGDGRFAEGATNPSVVFLLREWSWPQGLDIWLFVALGLNSAITAYALSQAYRLADAATISPFEYVGLPLALLWGWTFWGEIPDAASSVGILLIVGSGLFVFLRERRRQVAIASAARVRRRY